MKKEYLILAAVIAVLVLYLVFQKTDQTHYQLPEIPAVDQKEITKLEIQLPESRITLTRKDNSWFVGPEAYPADSGLVERMLDILSGLVVTDLVSESGNYARYDLGDDKKIHVTAFQGSESVRSFDIGKAAATFNHTYVRLDADPRVYHARENFRDRFNKTVEQLRDKEALSFDKKTITEVVFVKGEEAFQFAQAQVPVEVTVDQEKEEPEKPAEPQTETVWQGPDGEKAEAAPIDRLLDGIARLKAKGYVPDKKKEDFRDPICTIRVKGDEEYTLDIYPKMEKDASEYPAVSSQNDYPFYLPETKVKSIMESFGTKMDGQQGA